MKRRAIVGALLLAIVTTAACKRGDRRIDDEAPAVDVELMAFLSEARALHHRANLDEASGDLPAATAAMGRLVEARRPHDAAATPEVGEVLADAYARLAELHLRQGALAPAAEAARGGLRHAPSPTYFRGHLLEVEGLIEEARAAELVDAGKPGEAIRARERAIQLLEEVVKIQDQVIRTSLESRDAAGEAPR